MSNFKAEERVTKRNTRLRSGLMLNQGAPIVNGVVEEVYRKAGVGVEATPVAAADQGCSGPYS